MKFPIQLICLLFLVFLPSNIYGQGEYPELLPHHAIRLTWDQQGNHYATGHANGDIRIYDVEGRVTLDIPDAHLGLINSLTFSPDGSRIITGGGDGDLRIWNKASGALIMEFMDIGSAVFAVGWGVTGSIWATVFDGYNYIITADITTDTYSISQTRPPLASDDLIWNAAGSSIAIGGRLQDLFIVETINYSERILDATPNNDFFEPANEFTTSVTWHPTANIVANGKINGWVLIWNLDTPSDTMPLHSLQGNNGVTNDAIIPFNYRIVDIAFSEDERTISGVSMDGTVRVWDAGTGEMLLDFNLGERVLAGAFSPDGSQLVYSTYSTTDVSPAIINLPSADADLDQAIVDGNSNLSK